MAETLGSLCDKLTIVNLKKYHTTDQGRLASLETQGGQLIEEIDAYLRSAFTGEIPWERLAFTSNKVYKKEKFVFDAPTGGMGDLFSQLANANCELWHQQERVYNFEDVPAEEKNKLISNLAELNLKRTACIDAIDRVLQGCVPQSNTAQDAKARG